MKGTYNENQQVITEASLKALDPNLKNQPNCGKNSDNLVTLMARRLQVAEAELTNIKRKLANTEDVLRKKDDEIAQLNKKVSAEKERKSDKGKFVMTETSCECATVTKACQELNKRVADMEVTLLDLSNKAKEDCSNVRQDRIKTALQLDFDHALEIIAQLNQEANESQLCYTSQGATFKSCESVSMVLFSDGIVLGDGPFESYASPRVQSFFQDILDGYFPSEFQSQHPEGVLFKVEDKRKERFNHRIPRRLFAGEGFRLGRTNTRNVSVGKSEERLPVKGDTHWPEPWRILEEIQVAKPYKGLPWLLPTLAGEDIKENSPERYNGQLGGQSDKFWDSFPTAKSISDDEWLPLPDELTDLAIKLNQSGPEPPQMTKAKMSANELLKSLPSVTLRDGVIVPVRSGVAKILKPTNSSPPVTKVLNKKVSSLQITLKLRSNDGNELYIMYVFPGDPVSKVRDILNLKSELYNLIYHSATKTQILNRSDISLKSYGIVQNSHIRIANTCK